MMGKLSGIIDEINEDFVILDVSGVGYIVHLPSNIFSKIEIGKPFVFHIEEVSSVDCKKQLYGFEKGFDKACFQALTKINGVGPKVALNILGSCTSGGLCNAVSLNKPDMIRVKGVGVKIANRIVLELQGKLPVFHENNILCDIEGALMVIVGLGYERAKAVEILNSIVMSDKNADTQEVIKLALEKLS